jgi:uncharacterized protein YfaS (alpha-2-macroglobulin family)
MFFRRFAGAIALLLGAANCHALTVTSLSPQGEVAQVRQLVARFDEPAVVFGDARAAAPLSLRCSDAQATRGSGRWNNDREWVFQFDEDLPPGLVCTVQRVPGFRSPRGTEISGPDSWRFTTGGPFVQSVRPGNWERIDEEQVFLLQLNGPATQQSVTEKVWCSVEGLGERVPVRWVDGATRAALLKSLYLDKAAAKDPARFPALACARRLPAGARVTLVYGAGVATPSGVASRSPQRFAWQVREPFAAEFSCERENAQAGCLPIRPMRLVFNAPVDRKLASAITLKADGRVIAAKPEADPGEGNSAVTAVRFDSPLPERTPFRIELPAGFQDSSGRSLRNAANFPLTVTTAPMPPLAKFAAAPFGVVERFAEGAEGPALLPVTLRNVEAALPIQSLAASRVSTLQPRTDAEIIAWYRKVQRFHGFTVAREQAAAEVKGPLPRPLDPQDSRVQTRMLSLLSGQAGVQTLQLPQPTGTGTAAVPRPFEVVGIPLAPGFHVVEIQSPLLGRSLLDERHGPGRTMVVRTSALVTNLGVHFKLGRENALAWVTTLDKGLPVAGARVAVSSCDGTVRATATTDAQGLARFTGLSPRPPACPTPRRTATAEADEEEPVGEAWFISARATDARGGDELAFTWSHWNRGIEPWRFNFPTSQEASPDQRAHSIMDRALLRAGETVSMKHLIRTETSNGLGVPGDPLPTTLVVTHVGSGQEFTQPLTWRRTATGGRSAESQFAVPPAARLGLYQIALRHGDDGLIARRGQVLETGQFRVEEFRLPVLEGRIGPADPAGLVAPKNVPVGVQVNYVAGGPAVNLPVRVSALVRPRNLQFADHEEFSFQPPRGSRAGGHEDAEEESTSGQDSRVIADKLPLTLDRQGAGRVNVDAVPAAPHARELLLEATYADPNGEVQTVRSTNPLWPAAVIAGIRTEGWVSSGARARLQALALDLNGRPAAGVSLDVRAVARITTTTRKRMVGGFYTYDNKTETKDLGSVCSGTSDSRGLLLCEARLDQAGEVELTVTARDRDGRTAQAATSVWVTRQGELWFGGEDHDRMDLLPEKKSYQPGETARLQVRMPFRFATALVTVEREGIISQRVVTLNGQDPTVELPIQDGWGPNVYVSVLALRGRLREVPWYSLFTWGYKAPREWWRAFRLEGRDYIAPSALVDLSKPAYRLGVAEIRVGTQAHRIDVAVKADQDRYAVRTTATVTITGRLPDGKPAAGAEVALAAVDQSLLELMPNTSWNLLEAMLQRRSWGVETSTAQMEIIGRRHYGRKAVPAGGGGGKSATRELLDTLALWNPRVVLDANGQAVVRVPLNDTLTRWRIVAVADAATGLFGTGQTTVQTAQDLQIISGLPPLVREGDTFRAAFTLRNTTARAMSVIATPRATLLQLAAQSVDIPPGESREVAWSVTAPEGLANTRAEALLWELDAKDSRSGARDALKSRQRLIPAVPLTVQQASLAQLDGPFSLATAAPADALAHGGTARGGIRLALQPRLAEGLPGVRDWFAAYPYSCLEQKASKAVGLRDARAWQTVVAQIPTYLDSDGLASYFPPRAGDGARGSDSLTAYLLAAAHEAAALNPVFALDDAVRAPMERGLIAFVEGRLQRTPWAPRKDLDIRKLAALEALSRYGKVQARLLGSLIVAPNQWPTSAVIDWLAILKRVPDVPQREQRLAEATQILKSRLNWQGTKLTFSTEQSDHWWWLMTNGDVNTARLLLAALDDPAWRDDIGRLASGFIARQQRGAWSTTTANLWGGLALEKFSARFEATPVAGSTRASLGTATATIDWARVERVKPGDTGGAPHQTTLFGAPAATAALRGNTALLPWSPRPESLTVNHQGSGKPWLTLQSLAAVELKAPLNAGYQITRRVTAVEQAVPGSFTRGDVLRVTLEVNAAADMSWVVITDPVPGGATILGTGLGRDSEIATQGEKRDGAAWPAFEERSFEAFRSYYDYVPKGVLTVQYTLRLNNAGNFALPPTRVEAMYAPEMFGEAPNARMKVEAAK